MHACQGYLDQVSHVLLCNDSVIGPLNDLNQVFSLFVGPPTMSTD